MSGDNKVSMIGAINFKKEGIFVTNITTEFAEAK